MELSFEDRFHKIPQSNFVEVSPLSTLNQESKYELTPNPKKANPNKKIL
jgi:hypothetical protein